ncbi:M23 family metallopeptidase, partial [candidate division WOR-3 bacterium]|nr:M23 family metallopeptidase [candidate division WOR-3 bacterium]
LKESFEITKKKVEELDKTAKRVEPLLDIQKMPYSKEFSFIGFTLSEILDSLLEISKQNINSFSSAYDKLTKNEKLASSIPSIRPVDGSLVKGYGYINDIFTDEVRFHPGVTFNAMKGSPVYATGNGSIIREGMEDGIGLFLEINHGFGYITKYGHLRSVRVEKGDYVKRGDIIGYVGKTGRVTGPCLYYEVILGGKKTNPLNFIFKDFKTIEPGFHY